MDPSLPQQIPLLVSLTKQDLRVVGYQLVPLELGLALLLDMGRRRHLHWRVMCWLQTGIQVLWLENQRPLQPVTHCHWMSLTSILHEPAVRKLYKSHVRNCKYFLFLFLILFSSQNENHEISTSVILPKNLEFVRDPPFWLLGNLIVVIPEWNKGSHPIEHWNNECRKTESNCLRTFYHQDRYALSSQWMHQPSAKKIATVWTLEFELKHAQKRAGNKKSEHW